MDSCDVLVVEVFAPRDGDPIWFARKSGDKINDGDVLVRRPGKTERATSAELDALMRRAQGSGRDRIEGLQASVSGGIVFVDLSESSIEEWIDRERERFLRPMRRATQNRTASKSPFDALSASIREAQERAMVAGTPERREPRAYEESVEAYLAGAREDLPEICVERLASRLLVSTLTVTNTTERDYPNVLVTLRLPGSIHGCSPMPRPSNEAFPQGAPHMWGPKPYLSLGLNDFPYLQAPPLVDFGGPTITNGGSVTVETHSQPLRPLGTVTQEIIFYCAEKLDRPVTATWQATGGRRVDGVLKGSVEIPVVSDAWSVSDVMQP